MSDKMQDALNHAQDMVKGHYPNHREYQVAEALLGLAAARIAYASEFPTDAEGLPDVGSIHANIRDMKKALTEIAEQEHIELMLDPTWAQRVAKAAIAKEKK